MAGAELITVGWREWLALPALGLPAIKAKVDTGAKTSALHAFYVERYQAQGQDRVRFGIHPLQRRNDIRVECCAELVEQRTVSDSGGHRELRYVIKTAIQLAKHEWPVEITLTNRDTMAFRMLLGRSAMDGRIVVDPGRSYLTGKPSARRLYGLSATKAGKRRPVE